MTFDERLNAICANMAARALDLIVAVRVAENGREVFWREGDA